MDIINSCSLFNGLNIDSINLLKKKSLTKRYQTNEQVVIEGDRGSDFYLIGSGRVSVRKGKSQDEVAVLCPGDYFGFMVGTMQQQRIASVVTTEDTTLVLLNIEVLQHLTEFERTKIMENYVRENVNLVTKMNDSYLTVLNQKYQEAKKKNLLSNLFVSTVFMGTFYTIAMRYIIENAAQIEQTFATCFILLVYSGICLYFILKTPYPLSIFGLTLRNSSRAIYESLCFSIIFIGIVITLKYILINYMYHDSMSILEFPWQQRTTVLKIIIPISYAIFSFSQEFVARGVLQSSLQLALDGRYIRTRAIILSTLLFSMAHFHLPSMLYAALVILPSISWGWLYSRHGTLVGVTISHLLIGLAITEVIGFPVLTQKIA